MDCVTSPVSEPLHDDEASRFVANLTGPAVYALPLGPRASRHAQTGFSGNRQVQLTDLPPGAYRIIAFRSSDELENTDPERLGRLAEKGTVVTVPSGGTVNVQLDPITADDEEPNP